MSQSIINHQSSIAFSPLAYLIITYNGADHIERLLKSIPTKSLIVIFDNASKDDSVEIAHKYTNHIIENPENLGYAAGINRGLEYIQKTCPVRPDGITSSSRVEGKIPVPTANFQLPPALSYVFVLNQDTELSPIFSLQSSVFNSSPAIIQPRILLPNGNVNVDELEMNIFGFVYPPEFDTPPEIKHIKQATFFSGAAFLINLKKYAQIGPFDESLFMYCEDIDYALRIALKDEKILFDPTWSITHFYSNSTLSPRKRNLLLKNTHIIIQRYFPSLWRKLLFVSPLQRGKAMNPNAVSGSGQGDIRTKKLSQKDRRRIAEILLPNVRLGFNTKQFSSIKRFLINLVAKPIGYIIRTIIRVS